MDAKPRIHWMVRSSRSLCAAAIVLLVAAYFGSYHMLLIDESENLPDFDLSSATDGPLIIPPFPRPAYGEKYKIEVEAVRLFYWPANRLHRVLYRMLPD